MSKLWAVAAVLAGLIGGLPFAAGLVLVTIGTPAVDHQLQIEACTYPTPAVTAGGWTAPLGQPYRVGSGFGSRTHPVTGATQQHDGVDLTAPASTPVLAAAAGIVRVADTVDDTAAGRHVTVEHPGSIQTVYLHLDSVQVTVGQHVAAGQPVGVQGNTGLSTGPHLHFEYHQAGTPVDPVTALQSHGVTLDGRPGQPATSPDSAAAAVVGGAASDTVEVGTGEGGVGFGLPDPGEPRLLSLATPPLPVPADVQALYEQAATQTNLPWTLLAGIGMEETHHGAVMTPHPRGAAGIMQFLPSTWATEGRDGDGDGRADLTNPADSIVSAAFYLVKNGATAGPDGVRQALRVYNPRDFYLNDVLYYAHAYGGGTILGSWATCTAGTGIGDPTLPPLTPERIQTMFGWARARVGVPYQLGAEGPDAYDCSSYVQATFRSVGVRLPRTARDQRAWVAAGNGFKIPAGQEQPGDLVFTNTWLGPHTVGHVMMVYDPGSHTSLEEAGKGAGFYDYSRYANRNIYEFWRVGNLTDQPPTP